jgi:putative DNA primase/helicase
MSKHFDLRGNLKGRWLEILADAGVDRVFLNSRHGPCPFCGGKDRWRWDNKDGSGSGFCNRCDATGDGFHILGKKLGLSTTMDFARIVEVATSGLNASVSFREQVDQEAEKRKKYKLEVANGIWHESSLVGSVVQTYFRSRNIKWTGTSDTLRFHPQLAYYHEGRNVGNFPALIARVTDVKGNFLGIHRTYLSKEGIKASVPNVKMALGSISGGAVRFDEPSDELHVAEGIETSLAVREELDAPTWSTLSAPNMEVLEIPDSIKKLIIWADLDKNGRGVSAAEKLAQRVSANGVNAYVMVPPLPLGPDMKSIDWLDILNIGRSQ